MADTDLLPSRGVTFEALVDSTGVAINGSSTVAQLAAKGMRAACAVDGTGTAITGGGSLAQIAAAGIRPFCAVDQNGVAQDASTADQLRARGIRPRVLLDATGVALNGSAGQAVLASRGLQSFCPVDEGGNATTMGAVILISNTNVFDNIAVGATVGTLSVAGGSGTYTFTLTSNPGTHFATAGTNGVNLNTATALTAGSYPVTVQAAGGVPTPISRALSITVNQSPTLPANTAIPVISGLTQVGLTLTTTNGTWTGFPAPGFTYQWKRGGTAISGATANSYLLVSADLGTMITVTVTATNTAGNASATSAGVGPVTALANNTIMQAGTGSFILNGDTMTPTYSRVMSVGRGTFLLSGNNATLVNPARLAVNYVGLGGTNLPGSGNSVTVTGVPIGAPIGTTRRVILVTMGDAATGFHCLGGSIGGATIDQFTDNGFVALGTDAVEILSALVPSGTTATITINWSGPPSSLQQLHVYTADQSLMTAPTSPITKKDEKGDGSGVNSVTFDTSAKGGGFVVCGVWCGGGNGPTITSSTDSPYTLDYSVAAYMAAHCNSITATTTYNISTHAPPAGGNSMLVAAAFR